MFSLKGELELGSQSIPNYSNGQLVHTYESIILNGNDNI